MKKSITLILAIVLCLSLCACGKTDDYEATVVSIDGGNHEGEETDPKETVVTEPKRTEPFKIELTSENFLDFFEYAVEYNFRENAFGEVEEGVMGGMNFFD